MQVMKLRGQLPSQMMQEKIAALLPQIENLYKDLHRSPELSMHETQTASKVAEQIKAIGAYEVASGVGKTGVVCVLRNGEGPTVALRADMDALPVEEKTGLPYASTVRSKDPYGNDVPVMHACGHDIHTACLVGAAQLMSQCKDYWRGTFMALFQPGEETLQGAEAMLRDGVFKRFPRPDYLLGQHATQLPTGTVQHRAGIMAKAVTNLQVRIFGVGGHGAMPENTIDPVIIAAGAIMRMQTIVSREISARYQPVITVGSVQAGLKANVIPDEAMMLITLRSTDDDALKRMVEAVKRTIILEAQISHAPREPEITVSEHGPMLSNDHKLTERIEAAHRAYFKNEHVMKMPYPLPASEDFGAFGIAGPAHFPPPDIPYCYWTIGTTRADRWAQVPGHDPLEKTSQLPGPHSPLFAPEPTPSLRTGIEALTVAALELLSQPEA
ncbi:amidohydrolase [Ktedonosporobacter rubrisoli]|uniref:Amidohydrolase n=1 Tax=Ktedonosporobacter rubrisoli TaxID=2509675 RepID=A0A4P6JVV2_KTERU|nr:amidohydrolase [Ktedonosporobacter rubrisoli]QBD79575.1 amidohydrolase [Ktedonosporobacter rubrisoli]